MLATAALVLTLAATSCARILDPETLGLFDKGTPTIDSPSEASVGVHELDLTSIQSENTDESLQQDNSTTIAEAAIPITNHGGPIMPSINVYLIYYGVWTSTQKGVIQAYVGGLSTSAWWNIERKYKVGNVRVAGVVSNNYIQGKTNINVLNVVAYHLITAKNLPVDANGFYAVLTDPIVTEGQFCKQYCGYHTYANYNPGNVKLKFAFIGNAQKQCTNGCISSLNWHVSPNNDVGVDGLLSVFSHEIAETGSDPLLNAWKDANGDENGDKCNFNFGTVSKLPNGAYYNQVIGGRKALIQQNWDPVKQACAQTA